ncbi:Brix domain protein, partial [Monkeypox virus]
NKNSKKT